jgi:hypothetical protein
VSSVYPSRVPTEVFFGSTYVFTLIVRVRAVKEEVKEVKGG